MISKEMFDEFFLEGIAGECRHYGRSIYHLDGPGALRHLDSILSIPELDAVQWVPGAGRDQCKSWMDLYKKILAAGKSIVVYPQTKGDFLALMDNLPAKGLCIMFNGAANEDDAKDIMKFVEKWGRSK